MTRTSTLLRLRLDSNWKRYLPIVPVTLFGILTSTFAFLAVRDWERQQVQTRFFEAARERVLVIERELEHNIGVVQDVARFIDASRWVGRRQFREFVGPALKRNTAIQALGWVVSVSAPDREDFIRDSRRSFSRFQISEFGGEGDLVAAAERDEHFPFLYVQPYRSNKQALGLDLASIPSVYEALRRAQQANKMQVSARLPILGDGSVASRFAAYLPLYDKPLPDDSPESEEDEGSEDQKKNGQWKLRGFAVGVFRMGDIIRQALKSLSPSGLDIRLLMETPEGDNQLLYVYRSRLREGSHVPHVPQNALHLARSILEHSERIKIADQTWTVAATPIPGRFEEHARNEWIVLTGGIAFTLLLGVYLGTLVGRAEQVRRLVSKRTLELENVNSALSNEISERKRAERALQSLNATLEHRVEYRTAEAERRAQELEQFAYVASHDLKAPLRAISNLAAWLQEDLGDKLTRETREQLALMRDRVARMHALIEGLLEYSRVGRSPGVVESVDTRKLLEEIVDSLDPPDTFKVEIAADMPNLHTDRLHLSQVFANLIGNSLKHHGGRGGLIRVTGRDLGGACEFSVADDGPGIAPEYHDKVFMMFQTLEVSDYGMYTGIGLALVRKIVQEHGGSITLESDVGKGAKFTFSWADGK